MNYLIKTSIAIIVIFLMGCVKLEERPEGNVVPENFYRTTGDFEGAIVGLFRPLYGGYNGFDFDYPFIAGCGAEDIHTVVGRWRFMESLTATASQFDEITTPLWRGAYGSINNANIILSNLPHAEGITAEKMADFEGQARFMRAFSYFNLVRWFGEVPIITAENRTIADEVGQSGIQQIYDLIVDDLVDAESKLPVAFIEKGRPTRGAAKALLAKVYLTMAGWPLNQTEKYALARDKSKEVIDMGVYSLEPDFGSLWLVANKASNREFIFALYGTSTNGTVSASHLHLSTRQWDGGENGWGDFQSDKRFFEQFPAGRRKEASFYTVSLNGLRWEDSNYGQPYIAKYRDGGAPCGPNEVCNGENGDGFLPILRYADVLLMYAEAANMSEGSPSADALAAINQVRRRALGENSNTQPNTSADLSGSLSREEFDKAVLDERNWELAFEQNRWFDLVRRDLLAQKLGAPEWYPSGQFRKLLPKPTTEILLIKNNGLVQNEGY
ncbi:RagB/SusD family nutrient uptake outer membrane protein [Sphingobacterium deserti]|uniref:RagB/SusD domain protein n=1 Tax=Sphingobacterium deserti TaxID=1229276 RepID=A0A0B8T2P1_9SPHI|nr:RagB/SusD family nutrient uptake outer membrane protein [Sphingobacterium deserti]KGE15622.1 RagB/SusD domain protein [Sphingobacterium deserti]